MNKYGFIGKFKSKDGKRDELIAILLEASALMVTAKGCQQYIICKDSKDENTVCVSEIWDTKADHDNSLKTTGSMELIAKVMPLMVGKPSGTELEVIGGKGLP